MNHILDKYIRVTRAQLEALPEGNTQVYDTSQLQLMCLEKFANSKGFRLIDGLFTTSNPSARVMRLDRMVEWYNGSICHMSDSQRKDQYIETVYLRGRSLRRAVKVQQHWVKFL